MKPTPDLHSHSTASDGTLSPTALVQRAASAGVELLALTDHDTTDGLSEASLAANRMGIHLIPGVEISVTWGNRTIHVVGLNLDATDGVLQEGLGRLMEFRAWRAEEIGRRLAKRGIEGAYEGAKALSNGKLIGRTHFARFLVSRGLAADTGEVFKRFLISGKPGHVSGHWATLEEAVTWIRGAGGQAVIAHPARYKQTRTRMQALLGEFRELGGVGVEVVSGSHSRDDAFTFARHAREQHLMASAGSDYHGPENPSVELGRLARLPDGCLPIWHDWPEMAAPVPELRAAAG
ncbi:PHP domain-containing protein [Thiorhodococcus mannitoliphagus]|uniref:PHP domain-containing protein n=1 Tax=Thiorhodococcus mannitoliphagus TaxID=329406 RepID=A0A6P1E2G4_9GAMM|nr:PHP domain-containing protein [Thiorhodococcus mannitoliphagus]NEX22204.1 PHP domain-containing protein [Thiorhodococcus mannitoliphagus]